MRNAQSLHHTLAETTYVEQGEGVPIVFVHGAICDYRVWESQREAVAALAKYIAVNLRYHGIEPWPDAGSDYSVVNHVGQLITFIRALKAGPVHLVGQSYGAHVAVRVALQEPDILRSIVLEEPGMESLLTGADAASALQERNSVFGPAVSAAKAGELEEAARLMLVAIMNQGDELWDATPEEARAMVLENARTLPLAFSAPPAPPLTCEQLGQIRLPTLVINGAQSLSYYKYVGQRVAECIPGSKWELVANATHGPHNQDPSRFSRVLFEFLDAIPAS